MYSFLQCRFLARKTGLDGKTEEEQVNADIIMEHYQDYITGIETYSLSARII